MLKKIVDVVQWVAIAAAVAFIVLLFVDRAPGTKTASANTPSPYAGVSTTVPASTAAGATVFAQNCATCHGATGQGGVGPKLSGVALKKQFPDIRTQVLFVSQGSGVMPAFASRLSPAEIQAVVEYTRSFP